MNQKLDVEIPRQYIVLETHGGPEYATVVTDEDGNNKVFDSYREAKEESDNCQDGIIVEL